MPKYIVPMHSANHLSGDAVEVTAKSPEAAVAWVKAEIAKGDKGTLSGAEDFIVEAAVDVNTLPDRPENEE
jgi:hypothetical protein